MNSNEWAEQHTKHNTRLYTVSVVLFRGQLTTHLLGLDHRGEVSCAARSTVEIERTAGERKKKDSWIGLDSWILINIVTYDTSGGVNPGRKLA